ncbi:MAG: Dabb family protein [Bacteroidales bacterium]|nr:Dabb family protein [Bacteroidales bacterium]
MVKHIVCFKLANPTQTNCEEAKHILLSMVGKVPSAKTIDVHIDQLHSARSFDIILEVTVDSFDALNEYQQDPYHCNVVKKHMHAVAEKSIALDFEL